MVEMKGRCHQWQCMNLCLRRRPPQTPAARSSTSSSWFKQQIWHLVSQGEPRQQSHFDIFAHSSLHALPASPQEHLKCFRCHGARNAPGSDCQRRSSPFLPSLASHTPSEILQSAHSQMVFLMKTFCVCFVCGGTWIDSSHVIPEVETFDLGGSLAYWGGEDCGVARRQDVCSSVGHHVVTLLHHQAEEDHNLLQYTVILILFNGITSYPVPSPECGQFWVHWLWRCVRYVGAT